MPGLREHPGDAADVVAPVAAVPLLAQAVGDGHVALALDADDPVFARRQLDDGALGGGGGKDEALVVVGVLADQIHAAWGIGTVHLAPINYGGATPVLPHGYLARDPIPARHAFGGRAPLGRPAAGPATVPLAPAAVPLRDSRRRPDRARAQRVPG